MPLSLGKKKFTMKTAHMGCFGTLWTTQKVMREKIFGGPLANGPRGQPISPMGPNFWSRNFSFMIQMRCYFMRFFHFYCKNGSVFSIFGLKMAIMLFMQENVQNH